MKRCLEVVVVDDEEQITELLETAIRLTSATSNVHTFNDSILARDYIQQNPVDLLITDYKMPVMNGLQLMESAPRLARKILISGFVSGFAEDKLQQLNATFFEKPVTLKAIGQIVSEEEAIIEQSA